MAKLSWVDPISLMAIELDAHLLYFTKLSEKSLDFYFLVGPCLNEVLKININIFKSEYIWNLKTWIYHIEKAIIVTDVNILVNLAFLNSLATGRFRFIELLIFKLRSRKDILHISCEIASIWMPQDPSHDESTLVQVMVWCCQATSHYL